jgi:hypothetical protein
MFPNGRQMQGSALGHVLPDPFITFQSPTHQAKVMLLKVYTTLMYEFSYQFVAWMEMITSSEMHHSFQYNCTKKISKFAHAWHKEIKSLMQIFVAQILHFVKKQIRWIKTLLG